MYAKSLGFGQCKLCLLAPIASAVKDPKELSGKRIVTSFPALAKKYFDKYDTDDNKTQIKYVSGSVEAACGLGLADGVIDLVETGTTMMVIAISYMSPLDGIGCWIGEDRHCAFHGGCSDMF